MFEIEVEKIEKRALPKGYDWKVVVDPTRVGYDPGCFYGRLFRWTDIAPRRPSDERPWPEGIVFQHMRTGERVRVNASGHPERLK